MAIVENSVTEIGDVLIIQAFTALFGVVQLNNYIDSTTGETGTRYFKKEFSYSIDGVFFSDWIPLTNGDLQQVIVNPTDAFYINYRYTRDGSDMTGELSFQDITLNGVFEQPLCTNYYILPKSIFKDLFCYNPSHAHLCAILTNKLFQKGILAEYMTRNEGLNPQLDDEDFLSFWGTVCCFYALILLFGKNLENFDDNKDYLMNYLKQRDLLFCDDINLQDLQHIKANYFDEIRQRGTLQIFIPKSETKAVDGEFLRLICYSQGDEFIFDLITEERLGWWLGKSSPSYKGNSLSKQTQKTKEKIDNDFIDLNNYITHTSDGGSMTIVTDSLKQVALLQNVPNTFKIGFDYNLTSPELTNFDNALIVDDKIDYEISFWIKQNINSPNISFGFMGLDSNNNLISPRSIVDNSTSEYFFTEKSLNQTDIYYFVRGVVYNKYKELLTSDEAKLNIGFGTNLKMFEGTKKIIPILILDRLNNPNIASSLYIWGLKVRPLVTGSVSNVVYDDFTETATINNKPLLGSFGTSFLTTRNLLHIMYKSNNTSVKIDDLEKETMEKLIPYNSVLKTTIIT